MRTSTQNTNEATASAAVCQLLALKISSHFGLTGFITTPRNIWIDLVGCIFSLPDLAEQARKRYSPSYRFIDPGLDSRPGQG